MEAQIMLTCTNGVVVVITGLKVVCISFLAGFYRFYAYDMVLRSGGGVLLVAYDEAQQRGLMQLAAQPP